MSNPNYLSLLLPHFVLCSLWIMQVMIVTLNRGDCVTGKEKTFVKYVKKNGQWKIKINGLKNSTFKTEILEKAKLLLNCKDIQISWRVSCRLNPVWTESWWHFNVYLTFSLFLWRLKICAVYGWASRCTKFVSNHMHIS